VLTGGGSGIPAAAAAACTSTSAGLASVGAHGNCHFTAQRPRVVSSRQISPMAPLVT
jgi:hypothetical protein